MIYLALLKVEHSPYLEGIGFGASSRTIKYYELLLFFNFAGSRFLKATNMCFKRYDRLGERLQNIDSK